MLGEPVGDWRTARREAARAEILRVAGDLAQEHGLAGLALRDLARRLGMAAPSLYGYFSSKAELYDAMFAAGYREMLALPVPAERDLRGQVRALARQFVDFSLADPVRHQLLFQRTIPGFAPSAESYALAQEFYDRSLGSLLAYDGVRQDDLDLITAVFTGLVDQQISNDPGGDRWVRLLDDLVDLVALRVERRAAPAADGTTATTASDPTAPDPTAPDPPPEESA